jgi:hypothetical protein
VSNIILYKNIAIEYLDRNWIHVQDFFNSVFFTSIAGAAAGAIAGAIAAQRIADRSRNKNELLKEIRCANLAITHAVSAVNTAIAAKKQLIKPLFETYETQVDEYRRARSGEMAKQFGKRAPDVVKADFAPAR